MTSSVKTFSDVTEDNIGDYIEHRISRRYSHKDWKKRWKALSKKGIPLFETPFPGEPEWMSNSSDKAVKARTDAWCKLILSDPQALSGLQSITRWNFEETSMPCFFMLLATFPLSILLMGINSPLRDTLQQCLMVLFSSEVVFMISIVARAAYTNHRRKYLGNIVNTLDENSISKSPACIEGICDMDAMHAIGQAMRIGQPNQKLRVSSSIPSRQSSASEWRRWWRKITPLRGGVSLGNHTHPDELPQTTLGQRLELWRRTLSANPVAMSALRKEYEMDTYRDPYGACAILLCCLGAPALFLVLHPSESLLNISMLGSLSAGLSIFYVRALMRAFRKGKQQAYLGELNVPDCLARLSAGLVRATERKILLSDELKSMQVALSFSKPSEVMSIPAKDYLALADLADNVSQAVGELRPRKVLSVNGDASELLDRVSACLGSDLKDISQALMLEPTSSPWSKILGLRPSPSKLRTVRG